MGFGAGQAPPPARERAAAVLGALEGLDFLVGGSPPQAWLHTAKERVPQPMAVQKTHVQCCSFSLSLSLSIYIYIHIYIYIYTDTAPLPAWPRRRGTCKWPVAAASRVRAYNDFFPSHSHTTIGLKAQHFGTAPPHCSNPAPKVANDRAANTKSLLWKPLGETDRKLSCPRGNKTGAHSSKLFETPRLRGCPHPESKGRRVTLSK